MLISSCRNQAAYTTWAATYDAEIPPHSVLEQPVVLRMLDSKSDDVVLDAACGTGRYAELLATRVAKVIGCDISQTMLELARKKAPTVEFCLVDLNEPLPFADENFSKVVSSLAMKHIENLHQLFNELHRVIKPGGIFVFSTIHPEMDWTTYERAVDSSIDVNAEGVTFPYSPEYILSHAEAAGFRVTEKVEITADDSIKHFLTAASFCKQQGSKYVLACSLSRL